MINPDVRCFAATVVIRFYKVFLLSVLCGVSTQAFGQAIGEVRVSRSSGTSIVENELGCMMRYVSHNQQAGGTELHVQLSLGQDCRIALHNVWNELRRPMNGSLANLQEIEFIRGEQNNGTLIMRFDRPLSVDVSQSLNVHMLTVAVRENVIEAPIDSASPVVVPDSLSTQQTAEQRTQGETRRVRLPTAAQRNLFVIRVTETTPDTIIDYDRLAPYRSAVLYTNEVAVGSRRWAEVKLGFFESEAEAEEILEQLATGFPNAWITIANPAEQEAARQSLLEWPGDNAVGPVAARAVAAAPTAGATATIPPDRIATLMAQAKDALVRDNYGRSIQIYESLLAEPGGSHRRQAWEFLGVARQKNNEPEQAIAEFEAYLDEFPDGPESQRVRQRLTALAPSNQTLTTFAATPDIADNEGASQSRQMSLLSGWQLFGSASQYYLRGVNLAESSDNDVVAQSAMLSEAHLVAKRRGGRFDLTARANVGYLYDFADDGSSNQALVSYAYLDVDDIETSIRGRFGRQQQLKGGVLGRFDGLQVSYPLKPDITVNVTAGFPVDSPRFLASSDQSFRGASLDFDNLVGEFDVSIFANQQTVDGIKDRQAVGAQVQFQNSHFNFVGLLDYDGSYNVINTALLSGYWRLHDRITFHGRVRGGAAPFLTTRNAIIGQPVNTIRELFGTYTEGQIRRLARNRTADERFASGGFSAALSERLQFRFESSYLEYSATVASGGVAAVPESGPQFTYGGHFQGSGYFKPGLVLQLGYRHTETRRIDSDAAWMDLRFPVSEQLRIQTRVSFANRSANQNPAGDVDQSIVNPLLRIVYSGDRRYRIEFEAGGQLSNQAFPAALVPPLIPDGEIEHQDYYLQLGYTLDF